MIHLIHHIFVAILFFVGMGVIIKHYRNYRLYWKARKWDKVKGLINEYFNEEIWYAIEERNRVEGYVKLNYQYEYDGNTYESSQLTLDGDLVYENGSLEKTGIWIPDLNAFLRTIQRDNSIHVWVNPYDPSQSIIYNRNYYYFSRVMTGLLFASWGICLSFLLLPDTHLIGDQIEVVEEKTQTEIEADKRVYIKKYEERQK